MVLQLDGESKRNDPEEQDRRTEPSRPRADRSSEVAQDDNRKHGFPRTGHVDKSMQAPPNLRKAWETRQGADRICSRRTDHLQMAEAGHGLSAATLHAAGGDHTDARRAKEEDQNPRLGQARAGPARSASSTRKSTAWEQGKGAQQRVHARQRQGKGRKGDAPTDSVPVVPDGRVSAEAAEKMEGQMAKCL